MKTWMKVLLGISLSFMCVFTSIGYAAFTSELFVQGEVEIEPPDAIFIVEISNVQTSGATLTTSPVNIGYPSAKVMSEITFSGRNSYVSFDVLIMNGTEFDQFFDVLEEYPTIEGVTDSFSYANIDWSVSPGQGTEIRAGEKRLFTITLTYTGRSTDQTRKMLYEMDFVLDSNDLTQAVSKDVTDTFTDILNNRLEEDITYSYNGQEVTISRENTYQEVVDHMESDTSGNYIGNLMGADEDDKALLTALFGDTLTLTVGDQVIPVTVMVKQKDAYGSSEDDLVLYITADDLGETWSYVPVYATVYSKNASGEWEQVGDIFAGEARTNSYSGWYGSGSFNTETWRSTEVYYEVATGSGIDAVMSGYTAKNP